MIELGCDCEHQAVLVLGGVDVAGAEQHGERRHGERDEQREVAERRLDRAGRGPGVGEDRAERRRHRLELQRDVGDRTDDGDRGDGRRHRLVLAVARGDEVGDRGDVLCLGEPHDAQDQRIPERQHHHRADVDRQEVVAGARGEPDRAEERPRRAVDRERERIDQKARAVGAAGAVPVRRHEEQEPDIAERDRDDRPALQHLLTDLSHDVLIPLTRIASRSDLSPQGEVPVGHGGASLHFSPVGRGRRRRRRVRGLPTMTNIPEVTTPAHTCPSFDGAGEGGH